MPRPLLVAAGGALIESPNTLPGQGPLAQTLCSCWPQSCGEGARRPIPLLSLRNGHERLAVRVLLTNAGRCCFRSWSERLGPEAELAG